MNRPIIYRTSPPAILQKQAFIATQYWLKETNIVFVFLNFLATTPLLDLFNQQIFL